MAKLSPFIWFVSGAEEAMNFYVDAFGAKIGHIERYVGDQGIPGEDKLKGKVLTAQFELYGHNFLCLDGGEQDWAKPSGMISFVIEYDTQEEIDKVWEKLLDGGKAMNCGWITDKFGLTWQIVPAALGQYMSDPKGTVEQKQRVMQAMMPMVKMEIEPLKKAFEGK